MQQISEPTPQEAQYNQFLSNVMDYETCPFCQRTFFRGKLAYHLKLCNQDNPMSKNNSPTPKMKHKKNSLSAATHYQRCQKCKSRIPSFMIGKHYEKCIKHQQEKNKSFGHIEKIKSKGLPTKLNDSTDSKMEQTLFPRIKNYSSKQTSNLKQTISGGKQFPKTTIRNTTNSIKIRDELRCFRMAQEVQKISCDFCGRKFSQQAAQRHVPICSMLRKKQQKQIALNKKSKSFVSSNMKNKVSKTLGLINKKQQDNSVSVLMISDQEVQRKQIYINEEVENQSGEMQMKQQTSEQKHEMS